MYEEAILTVVTVRDFTQVFDSYAQFEESMIAAKMETTSEMGQDDDGACTHTHPHILYDIILAGAAFCRPSAEHKHLD